MYEITIETVFSAAHSVRIADQPEPIHGHDWRVTASIHATTLDADGFVCDFHLAEHTLNQIVAPFRNRSLNDIAPFRDINPSAEHVARHIATSLHAQLASALSPRGRVAWVRVTEAPGCAALYHLEPD